MAAILQVFDTTGFPPRWHCGRWSEWLGWLHICSDVAIFAAYMAIPVGLLWFTRQRRDLPKPLPVLFWLFGAFILACGLGHFIEAVIFWKPIYRAAGVWKAWTATVSWLTVAWLIPAIPKALALRSPAELQRQVAQATLELRRQRDAAEHLARIVEFSHDAIWSQGLDGRIRTCNAAAARLFGCTIEQICGRGTLDLIAQARRDEFATVLLRAHHGEVIDQLETQVLHSDASLISVSLTVSPHVDQGELSGVSFIARDIMGRRKAEAMFGAAVDASPSGMIAVDHEGRIVLVNAEAVRLFGYAREELLGLSIEALVPKKQRATHPALRLAYATSPTARAMGVGRQLWAVKKDGTEFPVEVGLNPIDVYGEPLILSAIVDRTEMKRERDALEAKTAELQRSNEELEQFAYVASHDLQEPLRMVVNFMGLFQRTYGAGLDDTAKRYVEFAVDGSQRMKELIDALLTYSRVDSRGGDFVVVDLTRSLERVLENLSLLIADTGARIEHDRLPLVRGDAQQIEQLLQNLITNAIKFRGEREPVVRIAAIEAATHHEISVQDNGIGFEARHAERIFQMFQRLHERSKYPGSGIGLAVAKRIVARHAGRIWATSIPNQGATFHFTLPRVASARPLGALLAETGE